MTGLLEDIIFGFGNLRHFLPFLGSYCPMTFRRVGHVSLPPWGH